MKCKYCGMEHHSVCVLNLCYSFQSATKQIAEQQAEIERLRVLLVAAVHDCMDQGWDWYPQWLKDARKLIGEGK